MGSNLGGHNTGAKAVRSEKTRPVLGMKDGSLLGSSLASAAGAFASEGVEGAGSFSIVRGAAIYMLLIERGSNICCCWVHYAPKLGARCCRTRTLAYTCPSPRRRPLGAVESHVERETAARATAKGSLLLAESASKPIDGATRARAASSARVAEEPITYNNQGRACPRSAPRIRRPSAWKKDGHSGPDHGSEAGPPPSKPPEGGPPRVAQAAHGREARGNRR